ncbi:unnamed protein product [Phytophthora lilii]|uniref:DNA 3'-5' helicase n=1 Tax=Phytophthora lilii TaxID=2077276 RepID=A0A9W6TD38_9STRA|nr:unnamed protein product [Phytophthora lilii]
MKFQALRAKSKASTTLKVMPTPRIALGTIPVINTPAPVQQGKRFGEDGAGYSSSTTGFQAGSDVVDLTRTPAPSPPTVNRGNTGYSGVRTQARAAEQHPSYGGVDDDADSLFDDVDVDALVANHQRAQQQARRAVPQRSPMSEETFISPPSTQTSVSQETASAVMADELRQSIKQTRENLRKVREECDDASLEGEVPDFMQKRRTELEQELEVLSRRYRECKGTAKASPLSRNVSRVQAPPCPVQMSQSYRNDVDSSSKNPTCSCGMSTVEARVQHGPNAKRLYYRCSTCGFHSWVDGDSGGDRYSSGANQTRQLVVERPCVSSDPSVNSKMQRAKRVLRDVFGHNAFRPNQERTVMEAFSGRDVFVLMPTGGGKSLCFQLPACIDEGVTIVISPLVSLIQDQVQQLEALDVGVANLKGGDQDYDTVQRPIVNELFSNNIRIKMLYVTPEKIASSNMLNNLFESLEKRRLLARFVIDEAHCISQWGHDFRKDYLNLGTLRSKFPSVCCCCSSIIFYLMKAHVNFKHAGSNYGAHCYSKYPNGGRYRQEFEIEKSVYYSLQFQSKTSKFMSEIADYVRKHIDDSGIIYWYVVDPTYPLTVCKLTQNYLQLNFSLSKKDCEQTAEKLIKALGFEHTRKANQISFYHAGLEPEDRAFRHHEWSKGKIKLICATVAFGMGINKPDVRYVIHHTIPQSVTHYYQVRYIVMLVVGTGSNSGNECAYSGSWSCRERWRCGKLHPTRRRKLITKDRDNMQHRNVHLQNLRRMTEFCENQVECRRTSLLEYFGEHFSSEQCHGTCDNCKNKALGITFEKSDVTEDCVALAGMSTFASKLLRGERVRIVCKTKYQARASASDGAPRETAKTSKKKTAKKPATKKTKAGETRKTTKKKKTPNAKDVVEELNDDSDSDVVEVIPPRLATTEYPLIPESKSSRRIPESHVEALAQMLKDWRASVCDSLNVMPYHILPTSGIAAIANAVPVSSAELLEIDGVGRTRLFKYLTAPLSQNNLTPAPAPSTRSSNVLDSLDMLDSTVEIVEAPPAPKSSPFFQGNNKRKSLLTSSTPIPNAGRAVVNDSLDDFDWDAWDAVDDTLLNQTSSSAAIASRKRALDISGTTENSKKRNT